MASKNIRSQEQKSSLPKVVGFTLPKVLLDGDVMSSPNKSDCLKESFSQDLVYAITNGWIKTPKSILYPYHIKQLTNNTDLINITCRLGYGISYSLIEEISTQIVYQNL